MSIVTEHITIDDRDLVRTYSDSDMMIEQVGTGIRYSEAVDPEEMHREYTETDEPIEVDEEAEEESARVILNVLLGGES